MLARFLLSFSWVGSADCTRDPELMEGVCAGDLRFANNGGQLLESK